MAAPRKAARAEAVYTVSAPLVAARIGNQVLHFHAGDVLPVGVDAGSLENLVSLGFVTPDGVADVVSD